MARRRLRRSPTRLRTMASSEIPTLDAHTWTWDSPGILIPILLPTNAPSSIPLVIASKKTEGRFAPREGSDRGTPDASRAMSGQKWDVLKNVPPGMSSAVSQHPRRSSLSAVPSLRFSHSVHGLFDVLAGDRGTPAYSLSTNSRRRTSSSNRPSTPGIEVEPHDWGGWSTLRLEAELEASAPGNSSSPPGLKDSCPNAPRD